MSTISTKQIEHNRNSPDGRNHACAPPANPTCDGEEVRCFALWAGHESQTPRAVPLCTARLSRPLRSRSILCVREVRRRRRLSSKHYPCDAQTRRKCSTVHNIFKMVQRSAAPSVTESSVRRYSWRTALCSKKCVDRFKACQEGDRGWLRVLEPPERH